ncbi:MAG TPA: hypothetical protein VJX74_15140, partial [Blastocatellia bacterium]|nr:hypothetical protein [Blastocatellia bacterium]
MSISKMANLPATYSPDYTREVFGLLYRSGCKDGTIYRDGSRDAKVLNLKGEARPDASPGVTGCPTGDRS